MARPNLGYFRRSATLSRGYQLSPTSSLFAVFPVVYPPHDGGLLPLLDLAPHWSFQDLWVPFCQRCLYHDMYVIKQILSYGILNLAIDNGTGAPAGWNWILSLCVLEAPFLQQNCFIFI